MALIISKSASLLNYTAFFILFLFSFIFIFSKNAAIFGYVLEFITLISFTIFIFGEIVPKMESSEYFVPIFAIIAIFTSCILHFVSLIFILMMIYKLKVKYSIAEGLPVNINEPYKTQLRQFNIYMITVFFLSAIMLFNIKFRWNIIDINLYLFLKNMNLFLFYKNFSVLVMLALSIIIIILSSLQVVTSNGFTQLTRQQLNISEYNAIQKNNKDNNNE